MTCEDVLTILEQFLDGSGNPYDWDAFTLGAVFTDPYLRNLQIRMANLGNEFPPASRGHYCGPEGIEVIRESIRELRARTQNPIFKDTK